MMADAMDQLVHPAVQAAQARTSAFKIDDLGACAIISSNSMMCSRCYDLHASLSDLSSNLSKDLCLGGVANIAKRISVPQQRVWT